MSTIQPGGLDRPLPSVPGGVGPIDGVLVIDKPAGPSSHDVVARVRRVMRAPKVGHTGTLDPTATGVLPLVLGRATRLARFLSGGEKSYEATIRLGLATDTFDAEGQPVGPAWGGLGEAEGRARVGDRVAVAEALAALAGTYEQSPPPFSAKKIEGVRAYELARTGRPAQPRPVTVTVVRLTLAGLEGDLARVDVTATAGFYVRVLAHELGRHLGVGGHLHALRRTQSGPFGLSEAMTVADLEKDPGAARARVIPLESLMRDHPAAVLTDTAGEAARHGRDVGPADMVIPPEPRTLAGPVRLFDRNGRLVAIAEPSGQPGFLHPVAVLG